MNPSVNSQRRHKSRGQATLEFVFILPLVFALILSILEFSTMLVQTQRILAIAREAANAPFRDCNGLVNVGGNTALDDCIDQIIAPTDSVYSTAVNLLPDFANRGRIIVSVYRWDTALAPPGAVLDSQRTQGVTDPAFVSQFGLLGSGLRAVDATIATGNLVKNHGTITIGEVYYTYQPITIIGTLLGTFIPGYLYEFTVY